MCSKFEEVSVPIFYFKSPFHQTLHCCKKKKELDIHCLSVSKTKMSLVTEARKAYNNKIHLLTTEFVVRIVFFRSDFKRGFVTYRTNRENKVRY